MNQFLCLANAAGAFVSAFWLDNPLLSLGNAFVSGLLAALLTIEWVERA